MINDSLPAIKSEEDSLYYQLTNKTIDSTKGIKLVVRDINKLDSLSNRLPKVLFSIDSLDKMK